MMSLEATIGVLMQQRLRIVFLVVCVCYANPAVQAEPSVGDFDKTLPSKQVRKLIDQKWSYDRKQTFGTAIEKIDPRLVDAADRKNLEMLKRTVSEGDDAKWPAMKEGYQIYKLLIDDIKEQIHYCEFKRDSVGRIIIPTIRVSQKRGKVDAEKRADSLSRISKLSSSIEKAKQARELLAGYSKWAVDEIDKSFKVVWSSEQTNNSPVPRFPRGDFDLNDSF